MTTSDRFRELLPSVQEIAERGPSALASGRLAAAAGLSAGGSLTEGVGRIDARAVILLLPRAQVEPLLPAGLQLAPQPFAPPGRHPVFVLCAHDWFEAWFGDMDYHEVMLGVPYVELVDPQSRHRGPFIWMPRLYLDHRTPRVLGNAIYGFEKLAADIAVDEDAGTYRATDSATNAELASLAWEATGEWQAPDSLAGFADVRKLFDMPTISQARRIVDADAFHDRDERPLFLCTTITYGFSDPRARVQPIRATLRIGDAFTPAGLPHEAFTSAGLDRETLGSFRMQVPQVVSLPGSCQATRFRGAPGPVQRVLVLGGGPAACAAAFWLAQQRDRFQVTLATQGFRLGGKCAGSRNAAADMRIEEHGLHAFVGFYENAFRTMREVYATAGLAIGRGTPPYDLDAGEGPVGAAFLGQRHPGLMARWDDRSWRYFPTPNDHNGEEPGVVPEGGADDGLPYAAAIQGLLRKIRADFDDLVERHDERRDAVESALERRRGAFLREVLEDLDDVAEKAALGIRSALVRAIDEVRDGMLDGLVAAIGSGAASMRWLARVLDEVRGVLRWYFADRADEDPKAWFAWGGLDSLLTIAIGLVRDRVVDLSTLDDEDFVDWLVRHGLDRRQGVPVVITQVYETLFAHEDDEPIRPGKLAAGVGLRWFLLEFFARKGWYAYDFRWGCAETMMTPYLLALRKLGVEVRFFHRVEELVVDGVGDERRLAGVRMQVQAQTADGRPYDPLVDPPKPGQPDCWPARPKYAALVHGDAFAAADYTFEDVYQRWPSDVPPPPTIELRHGVDFDWCVCGLPLGALPAVSRSLVDPASPSHSPAWRAMTDGIGLVQTISAQLWFRDPPRSLFSGPRGLLTGYAQPQPSLGQLSHLVAWEGWGSDAPRSVAYLTGSVPGTTLLPALDRHAYPAEAAQWWKQRFEAWLRAHWRGLFDAAPAGYEALLAALAVPSAHAAAEGLDRLWAQHFCIATQPSDLYVLSRPGETKLRLGPTESGVRFLLLCGDWTRTDVNAGCVEAATQSGMLAARALGGEPVYVWRTGF